MAAEEVRSFHRAPACLCVFCGLPAAGKSTLVRDVLRAASLAEWKSAVVRYDNLIPDHAFRAKVIDDGVNLQEPVNTFVYKSN